MRKVARWATTITTRTLTAFWNGRHWRLVNNPTPGGDAQLLGVAASWTHNIWAVGSTDYASTLIMHWNGSAWS
jgi:hypothetical protein